jgi:hypothetical protein
VLYPTPAQSSFEALINRAKADVQLSVEQVEAAHDIRRMRILLSHPLALASIDPLPTVNLIGLAHENVASVMAAVNTRDAAAS